MENRGCNPNVELNGIPEHLRKRFEEFKCYGCPVDYARYYLVTEDGSLWNYDKGRWNNIGYAFKKGEEREVVEFT